MVKGVHPALDSQTVVNPAYARQHRSRAGWRSSACGCTGEYFSRLGGTHFARPWADAQPCRAVSRGWSARHDSSREICVHPAQSVTTSGDAASRRLVSACASAATSSRFRVRGSAFINQRRAARSVMSRPHTRSSAATCRADKATPQPSQHLSGDEHRLLRPSAGPQRLPRRHRRQVTFPRGQRRARLEGPAIGAPDLQQPLGADRPCSIEVAALEGELRPPLARDPHPRTPCLLLGRRQTPSHDPRPMLVHQRHGDTHRLGHALLRPGFLAPESDVPGEAQGETHALQALDASPLQVLDLPTAAGRLGRIGAGELLLLAQVAQPAHLITKVRASGSTAAAGAVLRRLVSFRVKGAPVAQGFQQRAARWAWRRASSACRRQAWSWLVSRASAWPQASCISAAQAAGPCGARRNGLADRPLAAVLGVAAHVGPPREVPVRRAIGLDLPAACQRRTAPRYMRPGPGSSIGQRQAPIGRSASRIRRPGGGRLAATAVTAAAVVAAAAAAATGGGRRAAVGRTTHVAASRFQKAEPPQLADHRAPADATQRPSHFAEAVKPSIR